MQLVRQKPTLKLQHVHHRFKYMTNFIRTQHETTAVTSALEALRHLLDGIQTWLIRPWQWSTTLFGEYSSIWTWSSQTLFHSQPGESGYGPLDIF